METSEGLLTEGSGESILTTPTSETTGDRSGSGGTPSGTKRENIYGYEKMFSTDIQGHPALEGLDTPDKLGRSYIELKSKIGKSLVPPAADANDDARYEFLRKAGLPTRPKTQDEYVFENPAGVSDQNLDWFRSTAYRLGLPQEAANALQAEFRTQQSQALRKVAEEGATELRKQEQQLMRDWGSEAESNKELANRTLSQFIGSDKDMVGFMKELRWRGLPAVQHPFLRKLFASIGSKTAEGSSPRISGRNPEGPSSGAKAKFPGLDRLS